MLQAYRQHAAERAALGIPPLPLDARQTAELIELIKAPPAGEEAFLLDLLTHRVPPGVDDAAKVKASFLAAVAHGDIKVGLIGKAKATELLGTMVGGYNVKPLIDLLDDAEVAAVAAAALKKTLLMFDFFHDVAEKAKAGNAHAKAVIQSWADAEWFTSRPEVAKKITVTVFKVAGETNTDDLSPAPDAWSRPDIPLHYLAMLKNARPGITPEEDGKRGPMKFIDDLKKKGHLVAYVGDVVGTGSSRKSATNSVIWATGEDIPFVPNKRFGGVTLGGKIAPIFFNTQEDSGALPIEVDVTALRHGRRDRHPSLRRQDREGRQGRRHVQDQERRAVRRSPRRRPDQPHHRPLAHRQGARVPRPAREHRLPPADAAGREQARLHAGAEDGRPRLRAAGRPGHPSRHLLRAEDDHGRQPGHHRPDDPRRAEGPRLPGLLRRPRDAVVLPHRRLPEAGGREDAPRAARVHQQPRRRGAAARRRRDPQLAQPPAAARHRRHRRRQPHALPDRHLVPGGLGPRRLRRRHRRDAARHAGVGAGALQGQDAARHHAARPRPRDPALRDPAGPADGGQAGQEERLLGPHPRDRGPARPQGRAGVRALRRLGRAQRRRLHRAPQQGADHRVPEVATWC